MPRFVRAGHVDVNVGERRVVDGERALVVDAAVTRTEAAEAAADDQVVQDNSRIAAYKSDYNIGAADQGNRSWAGCANAKTASRRNNWGKVLSNLIRAGPFPSCGQKNGRDNDSRRGRRQVQRMRR